ncbi:MAG: PAS domain-containing sensor histidine kinase, partial [Desulfovibrionaceae bacterium]
MKLMALRNSLFAKIILTAGAVLLLGMGVGGWFSVHDQATSNMKHALESADRLTNTIRLGAHYAMMGNLRDDIASIITNTSLQEGIEHVRIFNKMGEIKYSNILAEVDTRTHIRDEACSVCHHTEPPLATLSLMERSRIFTGPDGIRRLGLIAPIYNTPGCSPGPCHVHPTDKKVLGLLDVVVTLGATDARRNEFLHRTILLDATVFLATFLAIFLLVHTMVNRPIQKLIRQTRRIAQ